MAKTQGLPPRLARRLMKYSLGERTLHASSQLGKYHYQWRRLVKRGSRVDPVWVARQELNYKRWCHDLEYVIRQGKLPSWYDSNGWCYNHPITE